VTGVINDVMTHFEAQEMILMGKSWGGEQAMNDAKEYPKKVKTFSRPASSNPSTIKLLGQNPAIYLAWVRDESTMVQQLRLGCKV
jgi:pimeloyl-ACP methyl ester carboxylesterase